MTPAGRAVERPWSHQDPEIGEVGNGLPAVLAGTGHPGPQVQPGSRPVHHQPGVVQGGQQQSPAPPVPLHLDRHVVVVGQCDGGRRLDRVGHHHPGVLAHLEQAPDQGRVARDERGAVARKVGLLGQRLHHEQPGVVPVAHPGVEQARHSPACPGLLPGEQRVALVGGHHGTRAPGRRHHRAQLLHAQDVPGGVRRRVEPDQAHVAAVGPGGDVVGRQRRRSGQASADVIGGVGNLRVHDDVARAQSQQGRQPGDELLRADRRQDRGRVETGHATTSREPRRHGLPEGGGPLRRRVPRRVSGVRERPADRLRRRVDRRADRQVDDAVGVRPRPLGVGRQGVPGKVRQTGREQAHSRQTAGICGGSAAMIGWSWSISPSLAAPPGEPSTSKNSTLAR